MVERLLFGPAGRLGSEQGGLEQAGQGYLPNVVAPAPQGAFRRQSRRMAPAAPAPDYIAPVVDLDQCEHLVRLHGAFTAHAGTTIEAPNERQSQVAHAHG